MRPRDFIDAINSPTSPRCDVLGEQAEMLRTLLVHLLFIDREFDKAELSLLARVLPDVDVREQIKTAAARRLDLERLAALFPDPVDRKDIVILVELAIWGDKKVERRELALLDRIVETLGVSALSLQQEDATRR